MTIFCRFFIPNTHQCFFPKENANWCRISDYIYLLKLYYYFIFLGQQPSGSDLQKSIQIATNVLSFSNKNEKCEGCCDPQNEFHPGGSPMYGQPEIHLVNGTSKVMFLKQTKSMRNLTGMYVQK